MEYHLFISHSWKYDENYNALYDYFKDRGYFSFKDFSIPSEAPLDVKTKKELYIALENKIRLCHVVLVVVRSVNYSEWIPKEIEIAKNFNKPIIAFVPRGIVNIPQIIKDNADDIVYTYYEKLIESIRVNSI